MREFAAGDGEAEMAQDVLGELGDEGEGDGEGGRLVGVDGFFEGEGGGVEDADFGKDGPAGGGVVVDGVGDREFFLTEVSGSAFEFDGLAVDLELDFREDHVAVARSAGALAGKGVVGEGFEAQAGQIV